LAVLVNEVENCLHVVCCKRESVLDAAWQTLMSPHESPHQNSNQKCNYFENVDDFKFCYKVAPQINRFSGNIVESMTRHGLLSKNFTEIQ